ncbi:subtilisin-like protease [Exidia glandulosa HHB12029]|uniref:Subtilisin-like protease n=1 Tax=Exidia glandulosa HHB12029 TaxID=1314781 RepID=A0A165QFW5_EXIGL|nr:subtilisin-like protease [Exidia glandulosa HHB12029]
MKVVSLAVAFFGVAASALAADVTSSSSTASAIKQAVPIGEKFVANKYILQFDHESELPQNKRDASVHETVYASLTRRRVRFRVHKEYKHEGLFVGAAVVLDSADDYDALETTPGVTGVFPVRLLKAMEPITKALAINATAAKDTTSTHVSTGVDKLHAEGKLGAGIKIGIIDTGVDYRHQSLGGGYGKGFKVAGGYDHVGDEYDGSADPIADNDPLDECVGHGTHVAGIIGADNNNVFNLTGVAPKATLYAYRVFSCYGVSDDSIIVDAMLRAYADGMDVITMSLGATVGFSNYVTGDVASKLADRGKIVTAAAGNSGEVGNWYTSSPAAAKSVISVASTDNTAAPAQKALVSGVDRKQVVYFGLAPLPIAGSHPVYATSLNTSVTYDACDPLPDDTPNLSNYIVLIRRGECALYTKMMNAVEKGAQYIMIYNNVPGLEELSWDPEYIIQLMTPEDGEYLVNQLAAGKTPTLSFPQTDSYVEYANVAGGLISYYSSMGPSFDMLMSPSIAAPGGNILSTWMTNDGSWAILSGTSMATPFMAGVAALLFEAKGKTAAVGRSARDLFQTTARPLKSTHAEDSLLNTISVQGAGLINAYDAIKTTTIVSPGQFALNDTEHIQKTQVFTITNKSNKIKTYKIGHVPAATVLTVEADTNDTQNPPVPELATAAKVTFGLNTVILLPGLSLPVFATFTPPKGLDAHRLPVYSGWITITSGDEVQRISYMGVAASLRKDKTVINNPLLLSGAGGIVREPTNFTFVDGDAPLHLLRLTFGTPLLQIDLVPADTKFVPTLPKRTFVKATKTVGRLNTFTYVNRNVATTFGDGLFYIIEMENPVFENGTRIPKGQYKILGRTLKVFGDPKVEEDYESWLSPVIGFP